MKPQLDQDVRVAAIFRRRKSGFKSPGLQSRLPIAWVLAHADDGVIWGRVEDKQLLLRGQCLSRSRSRVAADDVTAGSTLRASRRAITWRDGDKFHIRRIMDGEKTPDNTLSLETYWLWGTQAVGSAGGFKLLEDGAQGLHHAPPISALGEGQRLALLVRHYLAYDAEGRTRIAASRLYGFRNCGRVTEARMKIIRHVNPTDQIAPCAV